MTLLFAPFPHPLALFLLLFAMASQDPAKKRQFEHTEDVNRNSVDVGSQIEKKFQDEMPDFDDSIEETTPSKAVWLITFTVAMGGFLFGMSFHLFFPTTKY